MSRELNRMLNRSIDEHSAMPAKPKYSEPNDFLNKVVTPLYKAVQAVRKVSSLVCSLFCFIAVADEKVKEYCHCIRWAMKPLVYHDWHPLPKNPPALLHLNFLSFPPTMILFSTFVSLCLQEAKVNKDGKAPHSQWRNYDDMNEYFWYYLLICRLSKNVLEVV